tara:strand:+ start:37 stop:183 length:147 start_codon:yes stop_codon:yes gene_type:complete
MCSRGSAILVEMMGASHAKFKARQRADFDTLCKQICFSSKKGQKNANI